MRQFCTSVEAGGLFKGLALYHSLTRHAPGAVLWALCLDPATERALGALPLPGLRTLRLAELEAAEPRLRAAAADRSRPEYRLTCVPAVLWHLLTRVPGAAPITWLDPDAYFFSNPAAVLEESATGSVAITPRRIPAARPDLSRQGLYDATWLTVMDDRPGRECLAWWRNRCIEWCHERHEDGKFGHLKYLDDWPTRFEGVHVLGHPGAGAAPWNVAGDPIGLGGRGLVVAGRPLVTYRFRGFERITRWLHDPGLTRYGARMTPVLKADVYLPYLAELRAIEADLRRELTRVPRGWTRARGLTPGDLVRHAIHRDLLVG